MHHNIAPRLIAAITDNVSYLSLNPLRSVNTREYHIVADFVLIHLYYYPFDVLV
jgi:hypothetical protein